jgi:hypothetical protein
MSTPSAGYPGGKELRIDRAVYNVDDETKTYRYLGRNPDWQHLDPEENERNKRHLDGFTRIFPDGANQGLQLPTAVHHQEGRLVGSDAARPRIPGAEPEQHPAHHWPRPAPDHARNLRRGTPGAVIDCGPYLRQTATLAARGWASTSLS